MPCPYCEEDAATGTNSLCYVAAIPFEPVEPDSGDESLCCTAGRHRFGQVDPNTRGDLSLAIDYEIARAIG